MGKNSAGDDLIAVILAMNGNEKRYFRMHAQQWGRSSGSILKLYDYLLTARTWDEHAIKQAFAEEAFVRQLSAARNHLHDRLLEALRSYDNGLTYQLDFSRRLDEIDVLYRRKLISPCLRVARAAQRRAQLLELPLQELSVLAWLLRLERTLGGPDLPERLAALHRRHHIVTRQISLETELLGIHDAMLALLPQQNADQGHQLAASEALLLAPPLQASPEDMPIDARILYHYIHAYYAFIRGRYKGYWEQLGAILRAWEALPDRMRMEEERTFKILTGFADSAALAEELGSLPKTIDKLKRLLSQSNTLQRSEMARILNIELSYLLKMSSYDAATQLATEIEDCLSKHSQTVAASVRLSLLTNLLIAAFFMERWSMVLKWANHLATEVGQHANDQFLWLQRAGHWIAWYELHQHENLEKSIRPLLKPSKSAPADALALGFAALLASESEAQEKAAFDLIQTSNQAQQGSGSLPHHALVHAWVQARRAGVRIEEIAARE